VVIFALQSLTAYPYNTYYILYIEKIYVLRICLYLVISICNVLVYLVIWICNGFYLNLDLYLYLYFF
jgi:hypothetical protein